jgi:hypothetical protein
VFTGGSSLLTLIIWNDDKGDLFDFSSDDEVLIRESVDEEAFVVVDS